VTKILLASAPLHDRRETEVITIETVMGLKRRGHDVTVFTTQSGELAEVLQAAGIAVVSGRQELKQSPDVIHSSYVLQSLELAAKFPDVPQVFVCHDSQGWHSAPPRLSLVRSWGAVDNWCAERVRLESSDPNVEIEWVANALDLKEFPRRSELPPRPARVAVLAEKKSHLPAVREACRAWFLSLDEFCAGTNRDVANAAETLCNYDLVVATSRHALEALASGCAVILADHRGFAGLVTEENVEAWRRANFSTELLSEATSAPLLVDAIRSYDAASATRASDWLRQRVGMDGYLDQLQRLYDLAIRAERNAPTPMSKTLNEMIEAHRAVFATKQFGTKPEATLDKVCESFAAAEEERLLMNRQLESSDSALKKALHVERQMQQRLRQLSSNVKRLQKEMETLKRKPAISPVVTYVRQAMVSKWWRWKWRKDAEVTPSTSFDEGDE
jgi:hypothetical protein